MSLKETDRVDSRRANDVQFICIYSSALISYDLLRRGNEDNEKEKTENVGRLVEIE